VAARLEAKEAAATCAPAAAALAQAMARATDANALSMLSHGLAAVAARLGPKEAKAAAGTRSRADPQSQTN